MSVSLTDHGGASSNSCFGAMIEIINGNGPHDWKLEMRMGVNATWNDKLAPCINGSSTIWHLDVSADLPVQEKRNEFNWKFLFWLQHW